jgi:hypothetical protein
MFSLVLCWLYYFWAIKYNFWCFNLAKHKKNDSKTRKLNINNFQCIFRPKKCVSGKIKSNLIFKILFSKLFSKVVASFRSAYYMFTDVYRESGFETFTDIYELRCYGSRNQCQGTELKKHFKFQIRRTVKSVRGRVIH